MREAIVRGVHLNYRLLGEGGPVVALSPGGRRPLDDALPIAEPLASAGYRVLLHDRRNCGASQVSFDSSASEYDVWADDLHALGESLGLLPLIAGGASSGARLALLLAMRHPESVRALLLWRVTGGASAPELAQAYYGQFIAAAEAGGMTAVCATAHFTECIRRRPDNRERLLAMDPTAFIAAMQSWHEAFLREARMPVIGASPAQLQSIKVPACVVSGDDPIHTRAAAQTLSRLLPSAILHDGMVDPHTEIEAASLAWAQKRDQLCALFIDFIDRMPAKAPIALPPEGLH